MQYWTRGPDGNTSIACTGLANRTPPHPVTEATTFHCFSTTKTITALAILQLVAAGGVALDDPITRFLPDVPYRNGATVRQVLSHQAGLPNPLPLAWVHADADHARFDTNAFLDRLLREHRKSKPAGERARYSNIGDATGHALAWFTGRVAGADFLCHAGGGPGYGAEIRVYPKLRAASAIVTNTTIVSDMRWLDRLDATWLPRA